MRKLKAKSGKLKVMKGLSFRVYARNLNLSLFPFFLFSLFSWSQQVTSSIDTLSIKFGEQINYTIKVEADTTAQVLFPKGQTFMPLEMVEASPIDTIRETAKQQLIQRYALTQWDSGYYTIPRQKVLVNGREFLTDSARVAVAKVSVDTVSKDFFDIKPITEVERAGTGLSKNWLWFLMGLLLIGGLVYWFFLRRRPLSEEEKVAQLPPYDRALLKLKELEQSRYILQSEHKKYYSELTDIVRSYLEEEAHVSALESTTDQLIEKLELLSDAGELPLEKQTVEDFKEVLKTADLVKFAKAQPEMKVAEQDRQVIEKVVVKTHEVIPEPTEEELLQNQEYLEERARKKRKKRIVIASVAGAVLLLAGVGSVIAYYGFTDLKDSLLGHPTKELAEGGWVRSSYGFPAISVETPKVLKRTPLPLPDNLTVEQRAALKDLEMFTYGSLIDNFYIMVSSYPMPEGQEIDLNMASEGSVNMIQQNGAQNMVVKKDEFVTSEGVKGLKTFGRGEFKNTFTQQYNESEYALYTFANNNGLQQIIFLYPRDDRYASEIVQRIESSISFKTGS